MIMLAIALTCCVEHKLSRTVACAGRKQERRPPLQVGVPGSKGVGAQQELQALCLSQGCCHVARKGGCRQYQNAYET